MAAHGVSRSTRDVDLLIVDLACLEPAVWKPLERAGVTVAIRRAGPDDPLAGAIRAHGSGRPVDLVVGRERWQREIVERARPGIVDGESLPVATAGDLILLKLYAGAPQDAWDVEELLGAGDRPSLIAHVERTLPALPADSRAMWARIVGPR
jgi:hypothetical protein